MQQERKRWWPHFSNQVADVVESKNYFIIQLFSVPLPACCISSQLPSWSSRKKRINVVLMDLDFFFFKELRNWLATMWWLWGLPRGNVILETASVHLWPFRYPFKTFGCSHLSFLFWFPSSSFGSFHNFLSCLLLRCKNLTYSV